MLVIDRVARIVSEVFGPAVLVTVLLTAVGLHTGSWWGVPAAVFAAGIPMTYVVRGVRRGELTSHHIPEREHRKGPLLFGIVSGVAGLGLLIGFGAPRDVVALLCAGIAGLLVFALVTRWWKMSIHAGVTAGTVAVLVAVYGAIALVTLPVVPLVCWSRLRLSAHTPAQVAVGALVGAVIAATVFPALR